jgi:hypothetical protein
MAFSDYIVGTMRDTSGNSWVGGDDGTEQLHSSLSNPLTLHGTYCRLFQYDGTNTQDCKKQYTLDGAQHPNLRDIPDTRAVSVRMWVRRVGVANGCSVGIGVKTSEVVSNQFPRGYLVTVGEGSNFTATNENALNFRSVDGLGGASYNSGDLIVVPEDTWIQIRLDVTPVLNGAIVDRDLVEVYTNTNEATPSWTLQHSITFIDGVDAGFRPWANTLGYDVTQFEGVGFHVWMEGNDSTDRAANDNLNIRRAYVDGFEAIVKNRVP